MLSQFNFNPKIRHLTPVVKTHNNSCDINTFGAQLQLNLFKYHLLVLKHKEYHHTNLISNSPTEDQRFFFFFLPSPLLPLAWPALLLLPFSFFFLSSLSFFFFSSSAEPSSFSFSFFFFFFFFSSFLLPWPICSVSILYLFSGLFHN
ncbi:hypothetical protein ACOSP7_004744 [Xanthoceras sorbifolium]